ncbi:fam-l protein [Plasmodium malariae]|uniref:Fam-l protein n=1 Tax=Plasmodium malariae TaxID=5858 RepID=A0A1D3PAI3_PLAMA|nr:fam-l protein [Plasmodium malariae]SCN11993.1 fam-l protein [Plasmodium malariae]
MEYKIKSPLFNKIAIFVFLSWIYHFYHDVCTHSKFLNKRSNNCGKINERTYRLLGKCIKDNYSNILGLKEEIPNSVEHKKKDITYITKKPSKKKEQSLRNPSKFLGCHKSAMKKKASIFETKKYSYLEKKIFKELDYENFLINNKIISDKLYKKIICKKYRLRITLPLLFFLLLSLSLILDFTEGCGLIYGLFKIIIIVNPTMNSTGKSYVVLESLANSLKDSPLEWLFKSVVRQTNGKTFVYRITGFFGFLIYIVPFFILGAILVSGLLYYHKKVKKYQKIKFKKR